MNELLKISGALYDETRITILAFILKYGKSCVCELTSSLNLGQSRISRHLSILEDAGFLRTDRNGKWVYYFVTPDSNKLITQILKNIELLNLNLPEKIDACKIKGEKNEKCSSSLHG